METDFGEGLERVQSIVLNEIIILNLGYIPNDECSNK
jgi:hypothetical protein